MLRVVLAAVARSAGMGIEMMSGQNVGGFSDGQKTFLDFHRNAVFLQSSRK